MNTDNEDIPFTMRVHQTELSKHPTSLCKTLGHEPPQEWTPETVDALSRNGLSPLQDIADAHNAALAAERERVKQGLQCITTRTRERDAYMSRLEQAEQQLAALAERNKPLVEAAGKLARLLRDEYWSQCPIDVAKAADEVLAALVKPDPYTEYCKDEPAP